MRLQTVIDLSRQHHLELPAWDLAGLGKFVYIDHPFTDILRLSGKIAPFTRALVDYDACRRVTWEYIEDAAAENLDYIELRFSPLFMAQEHKLDPFSIAAVVCEACQEARGRIPIIVHLVAILSRTYGAEQCWKELEVALAYQDKGIIGLDLAGDEARHPAVKFSDHFLRAREAGLRITAHAGEFAGVESVRQTILELQPERIGHGVHAIDDPQVIQLLSERSIAVECCPTSNLFTGAVDHLDRHPLPVFLAKGICATINTDDPVWFGGIHLESEYQVAGQTIGLTRDQLAQVQWNSLQSAFISENERTAIMTNIQKRTLSMKGKN